MQAAAAVAGQSFQTVHETWSSWSRIGAVIFLLLLLYHHGCFFSCQVQRSARTQAQEHGWEEHAQPVPQKHVRTTWGSAKSLHGNKSVRVLQDARCLWLIIERLTIVYAFFCLMHIWLTIVFFKEKKDHSRNKKKSPKEVRPSSKPSSSNTTKNGSTGRSSAHERRDEVAGDGREKHAQSLPEEHGWPHWRDQESISMHQPVAAHQAA